MLNVNATSLEYTFLIMLSVLVVSHKDSIFPLTELFLYTSYACSGDTRAQT